MAARRRRTPPWWNRAPSPWRPRPGAPHPRACAGCRRVCPRTGSRPARPAATGAAGPGAALDRLEVRGLHLRQVVHEQEGAEMVVDAGALQVLAGGEQPFLSSASRPSRSWTAARSDQARHQSFHDGVAAVTSSKSVSVTPLATKRGAQWEMAERTRASGWATSFIDSGHSAACVADLSSLRAQ